MYYRPHGPNLWVIIGIGLLMLVLVGVITFFINKQFRCYVLDLWNDLTFRPEKAPANWRDTATPPPPPPPQPQPQQPVR